MSKTVKTTRGEYTEVTRYRQPFCEIGTGPSCNPITVRGVEPGCWEVRAGTDIYATNMERKRAYAFAEELLFGEYHQPHPIERVHRLRPVEEVAPNPKRVLARGYKGNKAEPGDLYTDGHLLLVSHAIRRGHLPAVSRRFGANSDVNVPLETVREVFNNEALSGTHRHTVICGALSSEDCADSVGPRVIVLSTGRIASFCAYRFRFMQLCAGAIEVMIGPDRTTAATFYSKSGLVGLLMEMKDTPELDEAVLRDRFGIPSQEESR